MICSKEAQGRKCVLVSLHNGHHTDDSEFCFIDERYPNHLGNGPDGYPMNNKAFNQFTQNLLNRHKEDATQATKFLQRLAKAFENE